MKGPYRAPVTPCPQEVTVKALPIAVAAAALLALAGCGPKPAAERPDSNAPSPAPSAALDADTLDATGAYLAALGQLDAALVADQRAAVDRGAETCLDIADKKPEQEQEQNVASRFEVDPAQAKKILAVAKSNLCLE
jgi:predicted small lipoprotein YifL